MIIINLLLCVISINNIIIRRVLYQNYIITYYYIKYIIKTRAIENIFE